MASSNNLNNGDCHTTPFRCAVVEEAEQARLAAFSGQIWLESIVRIDRQNRSSESRHDRGMKSRALEGGHRFQLPMNYSTYLRVTTLYVPKVDLVVVPVA